MGDTQSTKQALTGIRKLQRTAAKLRKRYLSPKRQPREVATREAVNYANAVGWSKPSPGATETQSAIWSSNWMEAYNRKYSETLAACSAGRFEICDKCEGQNDRADANYCTRCSAEFQAQTLLNPECQPVGSK